MTTTPPPPPRHLINLRRNLDDIYGLLAIHETISGTGPGRRHNLEVLNKSAIVLLIACWEAYVEDLALIAFEIMLDRAKHPIHLPVRVLEICGATLRADEDPSRIWRLAGVGWKTVLAKHKKQVIDALVTSFNTPGPRQINKLYRHLVGVRSISSYWHWKSMSQERAAANLGAVLKLRHKIAHGVSASTRVRKSDVTRYVGFIQRLAVICSHRVRVHLYKTIGARPWGTLSPP